MKLTPEKELQIREALGEKTAALTGSVFVRRPMIDSKQDWVELLGKENVDEELEIQACFVDFLGFTDSDQEGCDDDPVVTIDFRIHLFHEYREERSDDSTSTDDFTAVVLNLRNAFLDANRSLGSPVLARVETLPLVQSGFIILGVDPLTGAFGHFVDFTASVELR